MIEIDHLVSQSMFDIDDNGVLSVTEPVWVAKSHSPARSTLIMPEILEGSPITGETQDALRFQELRATAESATGSKRDRLLIDASDLVLRKFNGR